MSPNAKTFARARCCKAAPSAVPFHKPSENMKNQHPRTSLFVGIGWIATAAIAFCIGRIGTPASPSGNDIASRNSDSARSGAVQAGGSASPATAAGLRGQFEMGEGSGPLTLEKVTNGQPLDKWIKHLMAQEDNIVRMSGLLRLLETVRDPAELKAALEAINLRGDRGFGRGARFTEYAMIMEKWAQLAPRDAMAYVNGKSREEKWLGMSTALRSWTRSDPGAAIAWAQENKAKDDSEGGTDGQRGGPPGFSISPMSFVLSQLARTDLDKTLSVAAGETFDRRSRTLDTIAGELVSQRGIEGARNALEGMASGSLRDGLTTQLAARFAEQDPKAATDWASALPEGEPKSRALAEAVGEWAKKDPAAAGAFMAKLPATPENDRSREQYANAVAEKDPQGALAWANSITDSERQQRAVVDVARTWMRQDATAAKAWVSQSNLSEGTKALIQTPGRGFDGGFGGRGRGFGN